MSAKEILNKCLTDFKALKLKKITYNEYYVLYKLKYNKNKYLIKISIISNIDHEIKDIKNKFNIKHKYLNCFYSVIDTENLIYEKFKDLEYNNGLYKYFGLTKDCHLIESEEFKDELDEIKDTYGVGIKDNNNKSNENYNILIFDYHKNQNIRDLVNETMELKNILKLISDVLIQIFIQTFYIYQKYPYFIFGDLSYTIQKSKHKININNQEFNFDYDLKLNNFELSSIIDKDYNKSIICADYVYLKEDYFKALFKDGKYKFDGNNKNNDKSLFLSSPITSLCEKEIKKIQNKDFRKLIVEIICDYLIIYISQENKINTDKLEEIKEYFKSCKLNFMSDLIDALYGSFIVNKKYNINFDVMKSDSYYVDFLYQQITILLYDELFDIQRVFKDLNL